MISEGKQVLYYLYDGPKRSFVREELQVVPEDTELPPKSVLKGKHILFSLLVLLSRCLFITSIAHLTN